MADHIPSVSRYRGGCRCDGCRKAVAAQRRRERAAKPDKPRNPSPGNVVNLPTAGQPPVETIGPVERAVIEELDGLPKAGEFQGIAAAARAVAAAIDDPGQRTYISRNGNVLKVLLADLRAKKKKMAPRLAVVSKMAGRGAVVGDRRQA